MWRLSSAIYNRRLLSHVEPFFSPMQDFVEQNAPMRFRRFSPNGVDILPICAVSTKGPDGMTPKNMQFVEIATFLTIDLPQTGDITSFHLLYGQWFQLRC